MSHASGTAPKPAASPCALVVDDNPSVRTAIGGALRDVGFEVLEASDGVSALRSIVDNLLSLDLLVTDVEMPGLNGEALIRTVRQLGGEQDLPILVVTGSLPPERAPSLRAAGVDRFTPKSDGLDKITDAAKGLLAERGWRFGAR